MASTLLLLAGSIALPQSAPSVPALAMGPAMQEDASLPVWDALRALGNGPASWAVLLTSDADGDGRTDFLETARLAAQAAGAPGTPAEILVYGDTAARSQLLAQVPGAVEIEGVGAVFLTQPLDRLDGLEVPGVSLLVWEPRAYTTNTNPAGGSPSNLAHVALHQGGSAWTSGYTGSGVKIAVLDTGANPNHQALDGGKITAFKDCTSSTTTAYDNHGHGTHVASIAAGDDGTDYRGLAYQADLVIVKILDGGGSGTIGWFQCGLNYLQTGGSGADVTTMSAGLAVPPLGITTLNGGPKDLFGWDYPADLHTYYMPFTVAAGNWIGTVVEFTGVDETTRVGVNGVNQVSSPGFAYYVITVGAVDIYQAPATFTALGPGKPFGAGLQVKPDVAAMGVGTWGAVAATSNDYVQWSGTSMATPLAAAAIALMMDKDGTLPLADYGNFLRDGAGPGCVYATSAMSCSTAAGYEKPDPNYVVGHGVVKADNSLALV
ncbi:MAG TPA: S8 family serine peptidase [Candidatus Thermoplasmatota archaeon]|nr:S8 family serine peptidase [Candidatus Thermoplasmatota archaeon]